VKKSTIEEIAYPYCIEAAEKEVQDTSCRWSGGAPQLYKSPKIGGYRGLIETMSAVSIKDVILI
jgi:hypothetical protein